MEAMSVEQRLERLEKLNGITGPAICPDHTGEGSAWQGEAARSVPVGWVRGRGIGERRKTVAGWASAEESKSILYGQSIIPDPSIPWGEEYEAILPLEAAPGDEFWHLGNWHKWNNDGQEVANKAWRRRKHPAPAECNHEWCYASRWTKPGFESRARCHKCDARKWDPTTTTAEPAPGSDAEHPPLGYRREPVGGTMKKGYIFWGEGGKWIEGGAALFGVRVEEYDLPIANPIPANEGDSQKAESGEEWQEAGVTPSMMWDVIQEMRKTLDCDGTRTPVEHAEHIMESIAELRSTVESLTAELRAANHRAELLENEEIYSLKRINERMRASLEAIVNVDARTGSEYMHICGMRKVAREALR